MMFYDKNRLLLLELFQQFIDKQASTKKCGCNLFLQW